MFSPDGHLNSRVRSTQHGYTIVIQSILHITVAVIFTLLRSASRLFLLHPTRQYPKERGHQTIPDTYACHHTVSELSLEGKTIRKMLDGCLPCVSPYTQRSNGGIRGSEYGELSKRTRLPLG